MNGKLNRFYKKDEQVQIVSKEWNGSKTGKVAALQFAGSINDLVTVTMPEGNFDFKARSLKREITMKTSTPKITNPKNKRIHIGDMVEFRRTSSDEWKHSYTIYDEYQVETAQEMMKAIDNYYHYRVVRPVSNVRVIAENLVGEYENISKQQTENPDRRSVGIL